MENQRNYESVFNALQKISQENDIDFGLDGYTAETFKQRYFTGPGNIGVLYDKLNKISDETNLDFGQGSRDEWLASFGYKRSATDGEYETLDGKRVGQASQIKRPTGNAAGTAAGTVAPDTVRPDGNVFTESQLEAVENGAPVAAPIDVPNSPLQPEEYKIPKLFDYEKRKEEYSNAEWGKKQKSMMEAVRPGSNTTFEERAKAIQEAQEADETRKMVRGDYDKENFDSFYNKHIEPVFGEEKKEAVERAYQEYKNNSDGIHVPDVMGHGAMQNAFAASVASEKYTDPFRVVNKTIHRIQDDQGYTDYILDRMGVNGSVSDKGESPQLTDEESEMFKHLFSNEAEEVASLISDKLYDTYKDADAPQGVLDYISGKALHDNFASSLMNALIRRAADSSGIREQLRQMAYEQYGQSKEGFGGWSMRAAGAAAPFAVDMLTGGFAVPSAVGEAVVKGGVRMAAKEVEKEAVKRAVSSGISREAAEQAIAGVGERYLATNAPILNLALHTVGGAMNFSTYEAQSEAIRQLSEGEFSPENLVKQAAHGAVLGAATGGVGGAIGKLTQSGNIITKVAGDIGSIGAETGIFATSAALQKAYDQGISIVDVDWSEPLGESAGMVIGMKGVGMAMNPGTLVQRYNQSKDYDLKLNKHNLDELKTLGYDLDNIFHGLRDLGNITPMREETLVRGYELKPGTTPSERKQGTLEKEERVDEEAYRNIMDSDVVSSETKRKVHYLATGHIMSEEPVFGATIINNEDGSAQVETLNAKGQRVSLKDFDSQEEAQTYYDSIKDQARANTIGGLERICEEVGVDVVAKAKSRTEEETGATVDDLNFLANLSKEESEKILDTYVKNLHESYMEKFNENLKREERTEGEADGEAGADGTGGNEPPVSPSTERTSEPERPAEKPATEVSGTERRPAGEAAGTAAGEAAGTVRSERRQVAFDRGAEAVKNPASLAGVVYDRTLANTRLNVLLPDSDPILGHLRRDIIKAAEKGNDAEIDRLVEANAGSLNAQQKEAIELWRDAEETSRGVDESVVQEVQSYEQRRREELKEITNDEGNIVELQLRDGHKAYHLSGNMKNRYSGIMVKTDEGETKMVPVEHTTVIGEARPMEEVLRGDVDAYGRELEQNLASLAEGTSFIPGNSYDVAIGNYLFTVEYEGNDAVGNMVFKEPDGKQSAFSPQDVQKFVEDATVMKIQAQLKQEKDAAMEMQRNERYSKGIVGYTEGKPDLSNKKTDVRAAAEYLAASVSDGENDGHSEALKGVETEISNLREQRDYSEETVNRLSVKQELQGLSEQEEIALAESQQAIDEAADRRRKWGEIRQALMTDEERHKFEAEKQKDIKKAMDAAAEEPATKVTGTERSTERNVPTGKELLEKYEEQGDAENAVEAMRAELKSQYMNELYPKVSAVRDAFNDYRQGLTDKTPDELKQMATELKVLEAEENAMKKKSVALKNLASSLGRVYADRRKQQLSPHEYKMQQLEKETNKEKKLKLAKEAFKEDDEAMSVLENLEPLDIYEHIADNLGEGSLSWEGFDRGEHHVRGVVDMVGKDKKRGIGKDSDTIGYNSFLAPTGQGKGYDEVVHAIAEGSPYSTEDVANALYDMLTSASKPTDISHRIINERIARAEDIYESNLEREREAEEEAKREAETGIITNDVNEPGVREENDVILQQQAIEETKAAAKANADALRGMLPALTDKYHSLPIEVLDFHNDDIRPIYKELFEEEPTDEELQSFIDETLAMGAKAVFIGSTGKIYVFAHNCTPELLEEFGVFHENLHPLLDELDDGLRNSLFDTYWSNATTPEAEADKELIKADYQEEEWSEEFFVHHLAHKMKNGTTGKFFDRLRDEQQVVLDDILNKIGYDREKETAARRKAEPLAEAGAGEESARSEGSGDDGRIKSNIQGLEDYSEEEIKKYVREFVQEQVEMADADAEIVDIAIIGSRTTGTAKPDSDLDVLVEYKGKEREDDFYNLLDDADEPLTIGGISVDINPITEGKSGTIAQFLERNKDYKKEDIPVADATGTAAAEVQDFSARLATAKEETNTNPTEEQKKAGNYKMGHISFGGYRMSIENPKGSTRSGKDQNGKAWSIEMQDTYGYIGKKYGTDGDHLDFFINDDADLDNWNGRVYVVDQKNEDGSFDEHKVMYGYPTFKAAKQAYERNYEAGWWNKHVQAMTGVTKDTFDKWLNDSDHKRKPFAEYSRTKNAETITDNVDQLLADVRERAMKNVNELQNVTTSYKDGELEKRTIAELEQLKKKREKDASIARYSMKAFNIEEGSDKEHTLKMNEAKAKADIAAINEVLKRKKEERQAAIEQQEIGFAVTDRLNDMGYDVETDPREVRRMRKQAEKDQSEEGKMRHMQTSDGTVYGFVYRGKMYMDIRKIDGNLPLHEYAHPWCEAFRKMNQEGWKDVVKTMQTDKDTWDFVKQLNPDLKSDDDIAEEMIAKGTGEKGEQYAKAEYERMHGKDAEWKSKWNTIWQNIAKAIQDFWKQVGDYLHIKYETPEQVYDQVIRDFANNVNPKKKMEKWLKERDKSYLEAVKTGDEAKAKELFDAALRENVGSGIVPFVSTGGYRGKMQKLAHGVKTRDPKVIAEVADLMTPLIPKDAVLVPAPSHTGDATDMLDLAKAISERTGAPVADVLKSAERGSQYEAKYAGKPLAASEMGITVQGELPEGKLPVVIDNVVDTGNTAEACVKALGKGIVASLADSKGRFKRVAALTSAEPVVTDKNGKVVPLSKRFKFDSKYLETIVQKQQLEEPETVDEVETTLALIERKSDAYKEMVKRDQDRIFELGFSKKYENHPNRKLFNSGRLFGAASEYLEEAAFQLLGYERFSIAQMFPNGRSNPWGDIFGILQYAIEKKGLNPEYLKKVNNRDWNAPDDEYGMKPTIMSDDDWSAYTKSIMSGEKHLFTSDELREIADLLPQNLKEDLFHDLINLSRIKTIEDMKNHLLVMNDGDNAQQLIKAVRAQINDARENGAKKITNAMVTDFVKNALNKTEVLPKGDNELPQFMVEGSLFSDEDFEEPEPAETVAMPIMNAYGLNENSPIGKKLTELKEQAGKNALVGYSDNGMYVFPGEDGLTMTDIVNIKSKQFVTVDGMQCVAIPEKDLSIVSAKLVAEGYKLAITDKDAPAEEPATPAGEAAGTEAAGTVGTEPQDAVDEMLNEVERRKEAAKVRAEKEADKNEAEKTIDNYLKEQKGDSDETKIKKRATKAVLKLLKDNKVPYRLADEKEEKSMLKLFSMFNKEAVKNFARKVSIRSKAPHGQGRYCVYNMEDPFGVPMYAEKLSVAKEIQDFMNRTNGSSWEILDIGYADEAVEMPEELKNAANFQAMTTWHGSGAKFDAFDHSHMGEGEGAQAYGWGTYVTEVKGIGKKYAEAMGSRRTPPTYKGMAEPALVHLSKDFWHTIGAETTDQMAMLFDIMRALRWSSDPETMIRRKRELLEHNIKDRQRYIDKISDDIEKGQIIGEALDYAEKLIRRGNVYIKKRQEELDFVNTLDPKDFKGPWNDEKGRYLYEIDIPDEKEAYYIDYTGKMGSQKGIFEMVDNSLSADGWKRQEMDTRTRFTKGDKQIILTPNQSGADLYEELREAFGGGKEASQWLNNIGITGIKYPAEYRSGGREDGASNYVIFNEKDAKIVDTIQFMVETQEEKPVFFSNAMRAVEGIKQEKATPEQWLKMIEKAGGLKAGEDKWIGLSEWLTQRKNAGHGGSVTKQEVMDFIRENQIEVEDVHYSENASKEGTADKAVFMFTNQLTKEAIARSKERGIEVAEASEQLLNERYGDKWDEYLEVDSVGIIRALEFTASEDIAEAFGIDYNGKAEKPIDSVRLGYTTDGLENKREIALVVPAIEPYNENDDTHFGDAGRGRAVAWARFGDVTMDKSGNRVYTTHDDFVKAMQAKYDGEMGYALRERMTEEERQVEDDLMHGTYRMPRNVTKVCVIDEIQSKRHQDAREKGYGPGPEEATILAKKAADDYRAANTEEEKADAKQRFDYYSEYSPYYAKGGSTKSGVPDAPFEKNWHELAMKRMLRYAAENGYDKIAWTTGEQQAERYNIGNVANSVLASDWQDFSNFAENAKDCKMISIYNNDNAIVEAIVNREGEIVKSPNTGLVDKSLAEVVGKEMAIKLLSDGLQKLEGEQLRIGGEGMKGFYDQILPRFMEKYCKKWGVKPYMIDLPEIGQKMHVVDITPEMRESVMQGQPMFQAEKNGIMGWSDKTGVTMTKKGLNPNTPIHECNHLWDGWCQKENPELWKDIVEAMKTTPMWQEIKKNPNYRSIWDDDDKMASEVKSRLSGATSEEEFMKAAFKPGTSESIINKVKSVLKKFWESILRLFGKTTKTVGDEWKSVEAIRRMTLRDLMEGDFDKVLNVLQETDEVAPMDGEINDKSLVGLHNLSVDQLKRALKNGGLANPSVAVIDALKQTHSKYGDVTLVLPKSMVAAKTGKHKGVFGGDIYSPNYPQVYTRISDKNQAKLADWINDKTGDKGGRMGIFSQFMQNVEHGDYNGLEYIFLKEKGVDMSEIDEYVREGVDPFWKDYIKKYTNQATFATDWKKDKDMREAISKHILSDYTRDLMQTIIQDTKAKREAAGETPRQIFDDRQNIRVAAFKQAKEEIDKLFLDENGELDFDIVNEIFQKNFRLYQTQGDFDPHETRWNVGKYIRDHNLYEEYNQWAKNLLAQYDPKEELYNGTDNMGRQKFIANTLENASRLMKKQGLQGGDSFFAASMGGARAQLTPVFKTLAEIRKNKWRLGEEAFENAKEELEGEYSELAMLFENSSSYFEGKYYDLIDAMKSGDAYKWAHKNGFDISEEDGKRIDAFAEALRNMPTGYFELKFERPVGLSEFVVAVVPDTTPYTVIDELKREGLDVRTYDSTGSEEERDASRREVLMDAVGMRDDILFHIEANNNEVKPEPREISATDYQKNNAFIEHDQQFVDYISKKTGVSFKKNQNSNSWYGNKDGREIRISDHFNKRTDQDKYYFNEDADYIVAKINGVNPFEHLSQGDTIHHIVPKIGDVEFISYNKDKGFVEVRLSDGTIHKYDEEKFASPENFKFQKATGDVEAPNEYDVAVRDKLIDDCLKPAGIGLYSDAEAEKILADGKDGVKLNKTQKRALETVSVSEKKHLQTVISSADGAKVLKNLETLAKKLENLPNNPVKTFIGTLAKDLQAQKHGSNSEYAPFVTENGVDVTIRLGNHPAKVSNFDNHGEDYGISIVISNEKNSRGVDNDGSAHIVEYFYNDIKLRKSYGKPLADIVRAIATALHTGEYTDPVGIAEREEVNKPKFFKTSEGEVYGFALNGKIGIDRRTAKADTPIHEYGHLWAAALRKVNPEEWKNVVKLMKGIKDVWDAVKRDYSELKTEDDIAEEVLTQYSGKRGRQRFYEERERVLNDQSISGDEKVRLFTIFENVKRALHAFWGRVADFLHIHYTSAEQVADQVLGDLLSGVNPEREAKKYASETGRIKAKAEQDGSFMKAPDGSRTKLSEKGWLAARTEGFKKWIGGDWEALSGKTAEHTVDESLRNKLDRNGEPQEKYVQGYLERPRKPGKPKKKDSETMAEYFNRLTLYNEAIKYWPETEEQWKAVVYRHDGSALPDETAIHEKWMQKYKDDLAKWKEDNALAPDAEAPVEKPVAGDADPLDFTKTMADWRHNEALWKTAPDKSDYEREAEAEVYSMLAALELKHHPMSYSARMRQMGASLKQVREAVLTQKRYDQATVQSVVDFAKNFMSLGFGDNIGRGDLEGILTSVKRAVGARSIRDSVDSIMEKLVENHLRNLSNFLEKLTNVKDKRLNPTGVEVQGELDLEGQRAINEFRRLRAARMTPEDINSRLNELAEKITNDPENRSQWEAEYDGAHAALTYAEGIAANKKACADAEDAIRDAEKGYGRSGRSYAAQQELLTSLHRGLSDLLFERIDLYGQMFDELGGILGESRERAKEFREREKARVFNIHRLAAIDMAGKDANETHPQGWKQSLNNSAVARLPLSSLGTFEQLMKQFGGRHPNGEGALYNHFMRGFVDATNAEQVGLENAKAMLDAKASEVFGKKMQWSHLYYLERSMPTMDVTWRDGEGNQHTYTLSQGNMLAVYMWNKMHDGQMKLRKMDIDDNDVMRITEHIDPKLIELADWVQQEFLPTLRTKYNKVHEQEFGASMAEIKNYFPLRIIKDSIQKNDDLTADPNMDSVLPSTTTGSIIKRTVNAKPLDILNTDALSLIIEHIEEMEKWAAFTHWNKDVNTLLSYNRFKNQVKNMDTIYGSGDELWDAFRAACQLAAGSYRPKHGKADKAMTVIASGVTGAKIAFRPYTALKQLLSSPAFLYDAEPSKFAAYFCNPKNFFHDNFVWAMENLPVLRKRWHSRDMGDTRLTDKTGFGYWHTQTKKWVAQYGMWANGMIDALTCSAGARAVYETRLANYKKQGLDEAKAKEKALQDAALAYNMTQQSSEGAFVTPIQKDRTLFANMWTVFRNSSMSYTRQSVDAIRNLKRMYSNRQDMLYSLERTFREEEGLKEEDAKIAARAEFKRAMWKNMAKLAVCAFVLPWFWELGSKIPYLLFGDDDELKKRMLGDVTRKELVCGPLEGFTFGNAINSLWGAASNHDVMDSLSKTSVWKAVSDAEVQPLPMFGDMGTMLEKFGYDEAAAIQDMVNIACQMATGINPSTLTDPINAAIDASRGDLAKAKEIELFLMRVMMVPTESAQNIYLDELGMDAKKAQSMTYDELAERYAKYKFGKNAPMFGWVYSDEAEAKRMESYMKRFDKAAQDRIHIKDDESLRRQFERSESQKERKLISKEVAGRQDSEDYYVKNPGSTEVSKQRRSYYLMNRSWQDILEDIELERINREAKASNDSDKQRAVKAARKRIDAAINSLTVDKDAWNDLREARKEAIQSLK